jgi:hypothetical protein
MAWLNSAMPEKGKFCTTPWIFCCLSVNISLFGWLFHEFLHNWITFQVPYNISMPLCAEKLCLNYLLGLGYTLLGQWRELRHCNEWLMYENILWLRACERSSALCIMLHRANFPPCLQQNKDGEGWCQAMQHVLSVIQGDKKPALYCRVSLWFKLLFRQHNLVVRTSVPTRRNLLVLKVTFYFVKWCCYL